MDVKSMVYCMATSTNIDELGVYQDLLTETEAELKKMVDAGKIKKKAYNEVRNVVFNAFVKVAEIQEGFTFSTTYHALSSVIVGLIDDEKDRRQKEWFVI